MKEGGSRGEADQRHRLRVGCISGRKADEEAMSDQRWCVAINEAMLALTE